LLIRGRPPLGLGFSGGSNGSISAQSASGILEPIEKQMMQSVNLFTD